MKPIWIALLLSLSFGLQAKQLDLSNRYVSIFSPYTKILKFYKVESLEVEKEVGLYDHFSLKLIEVNPEQLIAELKLSWSNNDLNNYFKVNWNGFFDSHGVERNVREDFFFLVGDDHGFKSLTPEQRENVIVPSWELGPSKRAFAKKHDKTYVRRLNLRTPFKHFKELKEDQDRLALVQVDGRPSYYLSQILFQTYQQAINESEGAGDRVELKAKVQARSQSYEEGTYDTRL